MPEQPTIEQIALLRLQVEASVVRSEMSAGRSYQNAERNLAIAIHTAAALMIFGLAVDRYGLILHRPPWLTTYHHLIPDNLATWGGAALIVLGVFMSLILGLRYLPFVVTWHRNQNLSPGLAPFLAPIFALLVAIYGIALFIILFVLTL
ncbi:MAG: hypothetical protein WBR15_11165 [Gammaproteobacteria bacterium]